MANTPKLIVLSEQYRGKTFELTEDQHTVGRVDERDIAIKDPTISTYHCRFVRSGNSYMIEDQGSTNGTRVNNVPVTSQLLQNGDILMIGGVEILYDSNDKSSVSTSTATETQIDVTLGNKTQTIRRMDQMGFSKRSDGSGSQTLMVTIIVVLAVLVLGLVGYLIYTMSSEDKDGSSSAVPQVKTEAPANQPE